MLGISALVLVYLILSNFVIEIELKSHKNSPFQVHSSLVILVYSQCCVTIIII